MKVNSQEVKKLREATGAGIMDAKKALAESGSFEDAINLLRKKGHAVLAKKSGREAKEGVVVSYIHAGGKVGVLLELNCETDFVAKNQEFVNLANELALHIAAASPMYISSADVPEEAIEQERQIYLEQVKGKSEKIQKRVMDGKLAKFYEQVCLLEQAYVRDPDKKIKDLIAETVSKLGENIQVKRFVRFAIKG